jgi:hypothetical protein
MKGSLIRALALNRTVLVVLGSLLLFGMGEQLWSPFFPGLRSAATCWASLVGAVIWYWWGPEPLLYLAAAIGGFGAVVFYAMVGQARLTEPVPEREVLAP